MKFTQYYLQCLSHASYLIGDETTGRAVVVDPQRDVSEYIADAADAGHDDRARRSRPTSTPTSCPATSSWRRRPGARIVYSSVAETEFDVDARSATASATRSATSRSSSGTRLATHPSR